MSELISDTSKLDEAQKEPTTKQEEYFTKIKNFISATFSKGFNLLLWFIISLFIIYACKISQANVLPSDINCFPYTHEESYPNEIETNIFTNSPFSKPRKSMKMSFDVEGSEFVNSLLKSFRDYKEADASSFLGMYFYSIIESMFMKNYSFYSYMLTFLDALPEFILILFGPYLGLIILIINMVLNAIYFTWYWFSNLGWMWKKNASMIVKKSTGEVEYTGPPNWVDVRWGYTRKLPDGTDDKNSTEWGNCIIAVIFIIIFISLFVIMVMLQGLLFIPVIFNLIIFYTFFTYNMKLQGSDASFTDLFQYFFRYNKLLIMSTFAIYVVINAYTYLGSTSAVFAVLTIFLIYYLKIIEMFVPVGTEDERTSPLASSKQAKKVACEKPKPKYASLSNEEENPPVENNPTDENVPATEKESWKKNFTTSFFRSTKPKTDAEEITTAANTPESGVEGATNLKAKFTPSFFRSTEPKTEVEQSGDMNTAEKPKQNRFGSMFSGWGSSKNNESPIGNIAQQKAGGSNIKQIGGERLIRELKKFNKKYADFLLK